jgi:hypothetical protein
MQLGMKITVPSSPCKYLGDSLGTQKKALPKSGKAYELRFLLVVPTGIEPVSPP